MRILLTSNASYLPPRGGSTRSNLEYLRALAEHGHQCRVISGAAEIATSEQQNRVREELQDQHFDISSSRPGLLATQWRRETSTKSKSSPFAISSGTPTLSAIRYPNGAPTGCWFRLKISATRSCGSRPEPHPAASCTSPTRRSGFPLDRRHGIRIKTLPPFFKRGGHRGHQQCDGCLCGTPPGP